MEHHPRRVLCRKRGHKKAAIAPKILKAVFKGVPPNKRNRVVALHSPQDGATRRLTVDEAFAKLALWRVKHPMGSYSPRPAHLFVLGRRAVFRRPAAAFLR